MLRSRREVPPTFNPRPVSPLPRRSDDLRPEPPYAIDTERRRSNSDGTAPTPRPPPRPLAVHVPSPVQEKSPNAESSITSSDPRLRLATSQQRSSSSNASGSSLFVTHNLGMSRSQGGTSRDAVNSSVSSPSINAARTSPVKGRAAYDAKLMAREMDRLGLASHSGVIPSANVSTLSLPLSNQPTLATGNSGLPTSSSDTAPYQQLHVHVLPLFNSENLKLPIEDLNTLVKQHIQAVVSRAPSRALAALEQDVKDLVNMGMITLNAKLQGLEEETLLTRVVQIWGFFWDQVLPYLEGVFLPLQTEKILQNLSRNPKSMRPVSPGSPVHDLPGVVPLVGCTTVDVRNVVLQSFRDSIIAPIWQKLYDQFVVMGKDAEAGGTLGDRYSRLQQMLLVLSSASSRPIVLSQPTQSSAPMSLGEEAVTHLLRAILRVRAMAHSGRSQPHQRFIAPPVLGFGGPSANTGATGMLFGGAPRDRRGRIAQKSAPLRDDEDGDTDVFSPSRDDSDGKSDRQKEREFLEALKSPMPNNEAGSPEKQRNLARLEQQMDTRGLGYAAAMRTVI